MTQVHHILERVKRDEAGGVLVEFAVVVSLFLFLFFALLDFGLVTQTRTMVEKAAYLAARTAVVRPPACAGVPEEHTRHPSSPVPAPRYGTNCSAGNVCNPVPTITCAGSAANPTAAEIWARIEPLLPGDAEIDDLQFTYSFDPNLGFLGGPYTPMVTVELTLPDHQFISPLGALASAAGGDGSGIGSSLAHPTYSVTLPAEDLNVGTGG